MSDKIEKSESKNSRLINLLFLAAAVITIIGFLVDFRNTITYPGTDLRNRVVGARLILEGIDPYFFKWQPGLSEKFYDPLDIPTELFSKLSVPPTVLVLHLLFAGLPYLQQKIIWLFVQWIAFIGTIFIFIKNSNSKAQTNLILITSFLFANSLFWRFHVNSGQIYIFYVLLLSIAWFILNKAPNYNEFFSGIFVGITVSLRPPFILLFIPFLVFQRYLFILGGLIGCLLSLILSFSVVDLAIWHKYMLAMLGMTGFVNLKELFPPTNAVSNIIYPKVFEGFSVDSRNPLEYRNFINSSLLDILDSLDIANQREILVIGLIVTTIFLVSYLIKYNLKLKDVNFIFLFGILICLIGEFFIPIGRYPYYDIQLMLPLLIIISKTDITELISSKLIVLLLLGFLASMGCFIWVKKMLFFSSMAIVLYTTAISLMLLRQQAKCPSQTDKDLWRLQ